MSESKVYRWGIVGTGKIAQDFATALEYVKDAKIVCVGSRHQKQADKFGDRFSVPRRYSSHEEVAADPEVDLVYVSTFHPYHKEGGDFCVKHGKAMLIEKPICINTTELKELIHQAQTKKLMVMEAMWTRYMPIMQSVRDAIATIGDVKSVHVTFGFHGLHIPRCVETELGGGTLLDIGIYPLTFIYDVYGRRAPTKVQAVGKTNEAGADVHCSVQLEFGPGRVASFFTSFECQLENEAVVYGTKGRLRIASPFWCPQSFTVTLDGQEPKEHKQPFPAPLPGASYNFQNSQGLQFEAQYAQQLFASGRVESEIHRLEESVSIIGTLDEIRRQIGVVYPTEKK